MPELRARPFAASIALRSLAAMVAACLQTESPAEPSGASQGLGTLVRACDDVNLWPPFTYVARSVDMVADSQSSGLTGFSVELLRLIAKRHGLRLEIELLPWKRCLAEVKRGERFQLLLSATHNPERARDFLYSSPYYETHLVYLWSKRVHPNGLAIQSPRDFRRLRIGGVSGYAYTELDQATVNTMERAPNYRSLAAMLHLNRIDVTFIGEELLQGPGGLGVADLRHDNELGRAEFPGAGPKPFYMMFSRAGSQGERLQALVNLDLSTLEATGELARLRKQFGLRPVGSRSKADTGAASAAAK